MNAWIKESILQIQIICKLISEDRFLQLESEKRFTICTGKEIRDSIIQYLDGDEPKNGSLKRIDVPTAGYIEVSSQLFEINPKNPSETNKRLEYDVMIDGVESDLTIIFYIYKNENEYTVKIYDVLTL